MMIKYVKPRSRRGRHAESLDTALRYIEDPYTGAREAPDEGESEGYAALRRMVDPYYRLSFWSDFDGFSEEEILGYTPGDQ